MKEFVLVEFLANGATELETLKSKIYCLGLDYQHIEDNYEYDEDNCANSLQQWFRLSGRIDSMRASLIKLQDPFLSERMRISYISEELKNKYRS